jgi:cellulose biosynthesis protein BcsQ
LKILALYNIKGGVGKTAACVNLSYLASQDGVPTLLCDLDPQGSASFYFRIKPGKKFSTQKLLKGKKNIDKNIKGTDYDFLDLLPSDISYRDLDIILDSMKKSKKKIKNVLAPFADDYNYIFLDCPPNITLVSENIFQAAHHILVPLIPTTLSIITYTKLMKFFHSKMLDQSKILPFYSMVEKRKKMHQDITENYQYNDQKFLKTQIPFAADIEKMGIYRKPVIVFRSKSKATEAYKNLWEEIKRTIS